MPTFLLDIVIDETELADPLPIMTTLMWLTVRADGVSQTASTSQQMTQSTIHFNYRVRLVLNLPTLEGRYIKISLCGSDAQGNGIVLAGAQIRLTRLPYGTPKKFMFPLLAVESVTVQRATVGMTACISQVTKESNQRSTYTSLPPPLPPKKAFSRAMMESSYSEQFRK